jgi:methionyl-tRNA formyltransferase
LRTVWVSFDVIGLDCLEAAAASGAEVVGVVTLPGPVDPNRSGQCAFDDIAARLGAALIEAADINAPEVVAAVGALEPDVIFVVGWSQLVRVAFIATAGRAVYGMHPTLLPRHRGRAPIPWAILSGLAKTGVTLFEIADPTADSGPIVGQVEVPIARDETATTLYGRLAEAHVALIRDAVPRIVAGSEPRIPQDDKRASSWLKRTPLDGIIDWETRAPYLYDWVRAQTRPYPGAFTWLDDEKVVVWRALPLEVENMAPAGTIVERRPDGLVVACGDGALLLEEVETRGELEVGAVLG